MMFHHFRCCNCNSPINFSDCDEIPDEDLDLAGNPGFGAFKAWYTCPKCGKENKLHISVRIEITDYEFY